MRFFVSALLRLVAVLAAAQTIVLAAVIDVRELGARGDGRTVNTASIQAAIDEAHRDGGGVVRVTDGRLRERDASLAFRRDAAGGGRRDLARGRT